LRLRGAYVARRVSYALIALLAVLVLNFVIPRAVPGNPVQIFANPRVLPSLETKILTARFGLDQPVWMQFLLYLKGIFQWPPDFGISFKYYPTPVWNVITAYLPWTLFLVGLSTAATAVLGIAIGIWTGSRPGTKTDTAVTSVSMLLWTMPFFWLGTILLWVFGLYLHWFPLGGTSAIFASQLPWYQQLGDLVSHAFLPALTLTLAAYAGYSLIMRNTLVEELSQDYIVMAEAKGMKHWQIILKHAARNAMLPMITLIGLNLGYVVSGALLVEVVFSYQGVGWLTYQGVLFHDFPLLQGLFFILSVTVIAANLVADLLYVSIDPRIK
jgi:peptide/nickel transport system permease protein